MDEAGTWHGGRPQPGDFVLDGDPVPSPKGGRNPLQILGPCLLRPNGWMNEAGTWHGGRPQGKVRNETMRNVAEMNIY